MGDIKAKDLNTAGSVAAGDKILGSSINGTTANVTVETVGKYIIEQLGLSSLSGLSVLSVLNNLKAQENALRTIQYVSKEYTPTAINTWEYTGLQFTPQQNHIYMMWGLSAYTNTRPLGVALSEDQNVKSFPVYNEVSDGIQLAYNTGVYITSSASPIYLFEKRDGIAQNISYIFYIDLGSV